MTVLSSPKSQIHSSLLHLPASHHTMVFQPERQQQWEEETRLCIVYSPLTLPGHPENISLSLYVWLLQAVLQWPWPECIWYYSQLNVGFTEAAWIKRVTARTYLVLCNAENKFAEWGFNVFPYTNIRSTSWNIICEDWMLMVSEMTEVTLGCQEQCPSSGRSVVTARKAQKHMEMTWKNMEIISLNCVFTQNLKLISEPE